jgi:hypothetical protein
MTDKEGNELITQSEAAALRGMSLSSINEHVRSGRFRSKVVYEKRLVYKVDVVTFEPKTHKAKHAAKTKQSKKVTSGKRKGTKK